MGTPRALTSADQMRNVQRTASCGAAIGHDGVRAKENCRSKIKQSGQVTVTVAAEVALNSGPDELFASGWEIGAAFCEVAQQVLLAQQSGRHDFCAGASARIQVRAET